MSSTDRARRNRGQTILPPLAIIVIVLLCVLGLVAIFRSDGGYESPDARVDIPVDLPDGRVAPEPLPAPVSPPRP